MTKATKNNRNDAAFDFILSILFSNIDHSISGPTPLTQSHRTSINWYHLTISNHLSLPTFTNTQIRVRCSCRNYEGRYSRAGLLSGRILPVHCLEHLQSTLMSERGTGKIDNIFTDMTDSASYRNRSICAFLAHMARK